MTVRSHIARRRIAVVAGPLAGLALLAAACSDSDDDSGGAAAPDDTAETSAGPYDRGGSGRDTMEDTPADGAGTAAGATVAVSQTPLGEILVDGEGRTLYLFEADTGNESTCYDACAAAWPPFTTDDAPQVSGAAEASLLGTTSRDDDTTQVTYDGHPLYYFQTDREAGDANGQGVDGFGGLWWVLAPDGDAIEDTAS